MQREPVVSSSLRSVGYDPDRQVLEIEFQNGSVYQYSGVQELVYVNLMHASSKGQYFDANIRDVYQYSRVL